MKMTRVRCTPGLLRLSTSAPRKKGEIIYADNIFNEPCFVGLCMETSDLYVEELTKPTLESMEWKPAEHELSLPTPIQGCLADVPCVDGACRR